MPPHWKQAWRSLLKVGTCRPAAPGAAGTDTWPEREPLEAHSQSRAPSDPREGRASYGPPPRGVLCSRQKAPLQPGQQNGRLNSMTAREKVCLKDYKTYKRVLLSTDLKKFVVLFVCLFGNHADAINLPMEESRGVMQPDPDRQAVPLPLPPLPPASPRASTSMSVNWS